MTDERRAAAGRKGGRSTSRNRTRTRRGMTAKSRETWDEVHADDYTYRRPEQVAGGRVEDWTESEDDDDRVSANDRGRGNASYVQYGDVKPGHPNYATGEVEREWVGQQQGELLAYIESMVGGFRSGLGWPGTYRFSERAIVRRAIKGIPEEVYPEEER